MMRTRIPRTALLAAAFTLMAVAPAWAHAGEAQGALWTDWPISWDVVAPTVLALAIYGLGARRRRRGAPGRDAGFVGGVAVIFLALASPLDAAAARSFTLHQVQHLALRMAGPMLILWAAPQATLMRGLPRGVGGALVGGGPIGGAVRGLARGLTQPAVATGLFVGALGLWQQPALHNLSVLNDPVHYLMHLSLLLSALIFWAPILDRRGPPKGRRFGVRLMMIWAMVLATILLGAALALKGEVLYPAYDVLGRLFDLDALSDEQLGAVTIWVPSAMMGLAGLLIVLRFWARAEARAETPDHAPIADPDGRPQTAAALYQARGQGNKRLGLAISGFALAVFATALGVGWLFSALG